MANEVYRARQELKALAARTGQSYDALSKEYAQIRSSRGGNELTSAEISKLGTGGGKNSSAAVSTPSTLPGPATTGALSAGTDNMLDDNGQTDWSKYIDQGIANGVSAEEMRGYLDQRNQKIDAAGGRLDQYRDDEVSRRAQEYIDAHTPVQPDPTPAQPTQSVGNDPFLSGLDDNGDVDYSVQLIQAMDAGAPASVIQDLLDKRLQKADEKGYYQYKFDDVYKKAMDYINQKSGQSGGGTSSADYDLSGQLKDAAAGRLESALADLKSAYGKSMDEYDAARDQVPQYYQAAKNQSAAQSAMLQKNFDERAAASGLNSGASGQAALDASATYRGTQAQLDQSQANALTELDRAKAGLTAQYQTAVAKAKAEGNADLAQALYQELVRVQGLQRSDDAMSYNRYLTELERQRLNEQTAYDRQRTAQQETYNKQLNQANMMASVGDFRGYAKLFDLPTSVVEAMAKEYAKEQRLSEAEAARALAEWFAKWGDLSKLQELNVDTSYLTGG